MSNKHKGLFAGLAVVAIVAIVYFSFLYPPPSNDDTTGAIGAAKRYRAEQIQESDVQLAGIFAVDATATAAADALSDEQKADIVGRLTPAQRADVFGRYNVDEAAFGRMTPAQRAELWGRLTPAQRAAL